MLRWVKKKSEKKQKIIELGAVQGKEEIAPNPRTGAGSPEGKARELDRRAAIKMVYK